MRRNMCKRRTQPDVPDVPECSTTCRGTMEWSSVPDKGDTFMSLVSSRPGHRPICLSCLVLSLWSTVSQTLDETTLFNHTKKTQHADTSTALDKSQAAHKEEDEAGPASHRTREKLNMRQHVLDFSGSTLVQCTNHDEDATNASLQVPTRAEKK